jgi:AbrB family looped-hinge helix DNA binding protein
LSNVKVKRKGQVTIPAELRQQLKIEEGSLLEVRAHDEGILLVPAGPLEGGKVVGEESYRKILDELDSTRKKWR